MSLRDGDRHVDDTDRNCRRIRPAGKWCPRPGTPAAHLLAGVTFPIRGSFTRARDYPPCRSPARYPGRSGHRLVPEEKNALEGKRALLRLPKGEVRGELPVDQPGHLIAAHLHPAGDIGPGDLDVVTGHDAGDL